MAAVKTNTVTGCALALALAVGTVAASVVGLGWWIEKRMGVRRA